MSMWSLPSGRRQDAELSALQGWHSCIKTYFLTHLIQVVSLQHEIPLCISFYLIIVSFFLILNQVMLRYYTLIQPLLAL